jgi:hypothetical protein
MFFCAGKAMAFGELDDVLVPEVQVGCEMLQGSSFASQ